MKGDDLHAASVGVLGWMLGNLAACLDKAEASAKQRKFDPDVLFVARLAPDMLTLTGQIHLATAFAKNTVCRLAQKEPPNFTDLAPTLEAARARIAEARVIVDAIGPAALDGAWTRELTVQVGPERRLTMTGADYLQKFAMPNFYFHLTTAYAILRHNGVPLGKGDFLGAAPA
jgi:hypothetical protein